MNRSCSSHYASQDHLNSVSNCESLIFYLCKSDINMVYQKFHFSTCTLNCSEKLGTGPLKITITKYLSSSPCVISRIVRIKHKRLPALWAVVNFSKTFLSFHIQCLIQKSNNFLTNRFYRLHHNASSSTPLVQVCYSVWPDCAGGNTCIAENKCRRRTDAKPHQRDPVALAYIHM